MPAHPVAGTEYSGPDAGFAELFDNRWTILTPPPGTDPEAVERMHDFWKRLGANVETMTPEHHDLVLAITSHVPHLIAYNIVGTAAHLESVTQSEVMKFSAGGFRDFTRIASSDPTMWRDVFLNNREAVLEMLGRFTEDLTALQRNIRYGAWYLSRLMERFGHPVLAAAAYNAGATAAVKWATERRTLPLDLFVETIPYKETRAYVKQVVSDLFLYHSFYGNGTDAPRLSLQVPEPAKDGVAF